MLGIARFHCSPSMKFCPASTSIMFVFFPRNWYPRYYGKILRSKFRRLLNGMARGKEWHVHFFNHK